MKKMITLAAFAAALLVAPAQAQSGSAQPASLTVEYSDLDLSNPADVRRLDRRIEIAARTACGPTSSSDPKGMREVRRCRAQASEAASLQRSRAIAAAQLGSSTVLASGQ